MSQPIHLTFHHRKHLRAALRLAIGSTEESIQCHYIEWSSRMKEGKFYKVVPKEYRKYVASLERDLVAYRKLLERLAENAKSGE